MPPPCISNDARQVGRLIYIFGALSGAVQAFDLKIASSDTIPIQFPERFPVSGALALVTAALTFSMFFKTTEVIVEYLDDLLVKQVKGLSRQSAALLKSEDQSRMTEMNTWVSWSLSFLPILSNLAKWIAFFFDAIAPILFGIMIFIYCSQSMNKLFSKELLNNPSKRCDAIKNSMATSLIERNRSMDNIKGLAVKTEGHSEVLLRHTNPDGKLGGFRASDAEVPQSATIPLTSIVSPGAVLLPGQVIPDFTIVESGGVTSVNRPKLISHVVTTTLSN